MSSTEQKLKHDEQSHEVTHECKNINQEVQIECQTSICKSRVIPELKMNKKIKSKTSHQNSDRTFKKKSLEQAVMKKDANGVRHLLAAGFSPNCASESSTPVLIDAIGDESILRQLIDAGANVDATDSRGYTGLHHTIFYRNEYGRKSLKLLLSAGASPNLANSQGETPLLLAVKYGDAYSIQELVNAGASVDPVDAQPSLRLHMAVLLGDWETVESLLESGASSNYVDISGDTPLMLAIRCGEKEMAQKLIDAGADVTYVHNEENEYQEINSPLHVAVQGCNLEMLKLLLDRGADPNRANTKRYSVLSTATRIKRNRIPILEILLNHGADMYNSRASCGSIHNGINPYPFEGMLENNDLEGVQLFIKRGFDLSKYVYVYGNCPTPLHRTIEPVPFRNNDAYSDPKDTRMLSLLLHHYRTKGTLLSELEQGLRQSRSPLFCAITSKYEHAKLLMQSGADPNLEDCEGNTALGYVLFNDTCLRYRSIKLLIEHGAHLRDYIERLFAEANSGNQGNLSPDVYSDASSDSDGQDFDSEYDGYFNNDEYDDFRDPPSRRARRSMKKALCIVKHRILYEIKNSVQDPIHEKIGISRTLQRYYDNCKSEIDFMKTFSFDDSISYFDVLMDVNFWKRVKFSSYAFENFRFETCPADYGENPIVLKHVEIYINDLSNCWEDAYEKFESWWPAMKGLEFLLGLDKNSHYFIFCNILDHLNIEDLKNLGELSTANDSSSGTDTHPN
ncbi:hypothetical protein QAD02_000178 [Eretmocerus hayati]|uniref:Uncharacterized protein n=1 Tax=Eretmocerus hayati TaxID=131215 RepID=A0ACC2NCM5_9HYME|nr:hypothetical protein QAD02_000178 [Eretmocerus hayati]